MASGSGRVLRSRSGGCVAKRALLDPPAAVGAHRGEETGRGELHRDGYRATVFPEPAVPAGKSGMTAAVAGGAAAAVEAFGESFRRAVRLGMELGQHLPIGLPGKHQTRALLQAVLVLHRLERLQR